MHGGRMPARMHRVNAVRARVVEWTTGWLSGWSGSKELHHGGRARTTASNGPRSITRKRYAAGVPLAGDARLPPPQRASVAVLFSITNILPSD